MSVAIAMCKCFQIYSMGSMQEPVSLHCSICLTTFNRMKCLFLHKCQIQLCDANDEPNLEVRGIEEEKRLLGALMHSQQTTRQLLLFSESTGTALPGVVPLFFPSRHIPPILDQLGSSSDSYTKLRTAAMEGPVRLWKKLKFKISGSVLLVTNNLVPSSQSELKRKGLKLVDKVDHVVVYHISTKSQVSFYQFIFILKNTNKPICYCSA